MADQEIPTSGEPIEQVPELALAIRERALEVNGI